MGSGSSKTARPVSPNKEGKKVEDKGRRRSSGSSSSSSSSSSKSSKKGKSRKLSIDGNNNRNELIDVVLEYVNTNTIKTVNFDYASRLKATEVNWQWAIANGTATHANSLGEIKLQPTKNRRGWRNIRIYVSSTFGDFKHERDFLADEVFPSLREWCKERKLRLVDVDLRWGSDVDLKGQDGALLAINEINRCYNENTLPFFLGLLGERLAWVPELEDIPRNIAAHYGWIYDFSLYEMEILHGAYRRCNPNALFMARDPEFLVNVATSAKKEFVASNKLDTIRTGRLKKEIIDKFPNTQVPTYQATAKLEEGKPLVVEGLKGEGTSFGSVVTDFFKKRIELLYPLDPTPLDDVEERRQAHRNYMAYYADNSFSRDEIIAQIEKNIKEPTERSPIVVVGEHGCGKSTVLAQSAKRTIDLCKNGGIPVPSGSANWKVLLHFVGSAPGSTDLVSFLERLLKETGQLKPEVFDDLDMMIQRARNVLTYGITPIIIYIDSVNLMDSDQQHLLRRWLPPQLSKNVRVILSTTSDSQGHKILQKYYPPVTLVQLTTIEMSIRKEIFKTELMKYSITLTDDDYNAFLNMDGAQNTLWLSMACQYIISNYSSMTITEIRNLPNNRTGLQDLLIGGLDSGNEHRLVMAALLLIYTSRRGLLERELRLLLCTYEKSQDANFQFDILPYRRWAVVYDRLRPYLRTNASFGDGRLDFAHKSFSDAFEKRFLSGSEEEVKGKKRSWHSILADYFKTEDDLDRKAEELPFHLEQLEDVKGLADCLADWEIFKRLFSFDVSSDLIHYWQKAGGYDVAGDRYKTGLGGQEGKLSDVEYSDLIERVVNFDIQVGQYEIGIELLRKLAGLEESKLGSRTDQMADIYQLLANCKSEIIRTTDPESSARLPMEKEVVDYCERSIALRKKLTGDEHKIKVGETYIMMTNHLAKVADLEFVGKDTIRKEAEAAIDEAISLFEQMKDYGHKAEALMAKGSIYRNSDNEAEEKFTLAACDLCLDVFGEDHILSGQLCKKVAIMYEENEKDLKNAYMYYQRSWKIHDMLLGDDHPKTENLAELLKHEKFSKLKEETEAANPAEDQPPTQTEEATLASVADIKEVADEKPALEAANEDGNAGGDGTAGGDDGGGSGDGDGGGADGAGGDSGGDGGGDGGGGGGDGGGGGGGGDGGGGGGDGGGGG